MIDAATLGGFDTVFVFCDLTRQLFRCMFSRGDMCPWPCPNHKPGLGSKKCSAAEEIRFRRLLCFLWVLGEEGERRIVVAVGILGFRAEVSFPIRSGPVLSAREEKGQIDSSWSSVVLCSDLGCGLNDNCLCFLSGLLQCRLTSDHLFFGSWLVWSSEDDGLCLKSALFFIVLPFSRVIAAHDFVRRFSMASGAVVVLVSLTARLGLQIRKCGVYGPTLLGSAFCTGEQQSLNPKPISDDLPPLSSPRHWAKQVGIIGGLGLYAATQNLYNVDGGHRAIMFNRLVGVKDKVYPEGTHLMVPWFERPVIYDVRARPYCWRGSKPRRPTTLFYCSRGWYDIQLSSQGQQIQFYSSHQTFTNENDRMHVPDFIAHDGDDHDGDDMPGAISVVSKVDGGRNERAETSIAVASLSGRHQETFGVKVFKGGQEAT
ncbi:hypothetical protein F2Q68_00036200 [Brassica cretica]|uniref:Prohibitin n=1 Tax=Brassica cretica TaxID=69181 RepID=A0A8S9H7N3_BRACR|nr:hypothetical protein F2Q68_00036200 [Brassica cretica]